MEANGSRSAPMGAYALILVIPALWSANYVLARAAAGVIAPFRLALLRWLLAAAVLLAMSWRELRRAPSGWRREWPHLLVLGGLGMAICGAVPYVAAHTTSAVNLSLLYALAPVLIVLLSARVLGEQIGSAQVVGTALSLAGVLIVVFKADWENVTALRLTPGDLLTCAAVLAWTGYSVLLRRWKSVLGDTARLALIALAGVVCLVPCALYEATRADSPPWTWQATAIVVIAALVPGIGAYRSYAYAQQQLGAARTSLVLYPGPLFTGLAAWVLLGERPHWFHAVAAALILPGLYLATRTREHAEPWRPARAAPMPDEASQHARCFSRLRRVHHDVHPAPAPAAAARRAEQAPAARRRR